MVNPGLGNRLETVCYSFCIGSLNNVCKLDRRQDWITLNRSNLRYRRILASIGGSKGVFAIRTVEVF